MRWFNPLNEERPNAAEFTCALCGWTGAKWRWRPVRVDVVSSSPPAQLEAHYQAAGLSLSESLADPDRRVLGGPVAKFDGIPRFAARTAEIALEQEVALIFAAGQPDFLRVVPYGEVRGLVFVKAQDLPRNIGGMAVDPSYGALVWETGRLTVTFLFGQPDVCRGLFSPALTRIDARRTS